MNAAVMELPVPLRGQPLNIETMTWMEAAILLCREYLLLEPTRVHGPRHKEQYPVVDDAD